MKKRILIEKEKVNIDDMEETAKFLSGILKDGDLVIMKGDLGFGKTTFIKKFAKLLQSEDVVTSPSFTLINEYDVILNGKKNLLRHADLYRLSSEDELDGIGLKEKIWEYGITMIEWGDKFESYFDKPYYLFEIEMPDTPESGRLYRISLIE